MIVYVGLHGKVLLWFFLWSKIQKEFLSKSTAILIFPVCLLDFHLAAIYVQHTHTHPLFQKDSNSTTDQGQKILIHWLNENVTCVQLLSWISGQTSNKHRQRHVSLWNRKGTQWATWGLIWSLWVSTGLKWTHYEWPYFAVAKLGLNWSQYVSFWVATTKLHPQQARTVSFWVTPSCED